MWSPAAGLRAERGWGMHERHLEPEALVKVSARSCAVYGHACRQDGTRASARGYAVIRLPPGWATVSRSLAPAVATLERNGEQEGICLVIGGHPIGVLFVSCLFVSRPGGARFFGSGCTTSSGGVIRPLPLYVVGGVDFRSPFGKACVAVERLASGARLGAQ